MERAAIFCRGGAVQAGHLPSELRSPGPLPPAEDSAGGGASWAPGTDFQTAKVRAVELFERRFLSAALKEAEGNLSRAARDIGMHRQNLQKKLRQLGIDAGVWAKT